MNAGSNPAVLRALVARVWAFAYWATEDAPLAEAMLANACRAGIEAVLSVSERETLVRMLAAAHGVLRSGGACESYERTGRVARGSSVAPTDTQTRMLFEFRLLAPLERATLLLSEVDDLTCEETARVLGVSADLARLAHVAVRLKLGRAFSERGR
ncbi:hypothetical protein BGLT_01043 [Caballeronia glathei]|uniref:Lipoprotein n=1 Tax=Caballeronia glathei TaxID=60547 RepID=A0A069PLZ7_9BURK|nr:hypothetical protein [Caballeronia glathei]KDR41688.1 lipoprotein [Caballeronia glathei]CDY78170.1 hypothetical protein BGLT_01043 [Caballeronia glathei]